MTHASTWHRHGRRRHAHPHAGPHRHLLWLRGWEPDQHEHTHTRDHDHTHAHGHDHGHSHGLVDRSIVRSREGVKAVALSLGILGLTALAQLVVFLGTGSVALFADLVHNFGDALTAVPLGIAFFLRSFVRRGSPASPSSSRSSSPRAWPSTRRSSASSSPRN